MRRMPSRFSPALALTLLLVTFLSTVYAMRSCYGAGRSLEAKTSSQG